MDKKIHFALPVLFLSLVIFGISFNFLVLSNNNCKMPVHSDYNYQTNKHFTFQNSSEIKFFYFADIFGIRDIFMFSIGDILLLSGSIGYVFWVGLRLYSIIRGKKYETKI